jgi:hypothetical protein
VATGEDPLFEARTPLAFLVRVTLRRWQLIIAEKHPAMAGRELDVRAALEMPDEVRQSQTDSAVLLFYKLQRKGRWLCAVAKRQGSGGF